MASSIAKTRSGSLCGSSEAGSASLSLVCPRRLAQHSRCQRNGRCPTQISANSSERTASPTRESKTGKTGKEDKRLAPMSNSNIIPLPASFNLLATRTSQTGPKKPSQAAKTFGRPSSAGLKLRPKQRLASPRKVVLRERTAEEQTKASDQASQGRRSVLQRLLRLEEKIASKEGPLSETEAGSPNKAFPFIKRQAGGQSLDGLHKPVGLVFTSAYLLTTACMLSGVSCAPIWLPPVAGGLVGSLYAALNRYGMKRAWKAPAAPLNVLITGSTKGLGKGIAREFLRAGDRVVVTSRSYQGARQAAAELREEVSSEAWVAGLECEVSSPASVDRLVSNAQGMMGHIDVWINNAGYSGSFQSFLDATPEQIARVVQTNLLGSLLCTRAALRIMGQQETGGHIFNMDGAGADGMATPQYAAYGATKAGIAHLMGSLTHEVSELPNPVGVHTLSPGMVLTDLLLDGATQQNKQIFNILCEQPETVAAFLVPRVRTVVAHSSPSSYIRFLTLQRALTRFITAPFRASRFFDADGEPVYLGERERIMGEKAKQTERLAKKAARRSRSLAVAYSVSLAVSYLLIAANTINILPLQ